MMPPWTVSAGATCSTISPSFNERTSALLSSSVSFTMVFGRHTFHFFGAIVFMGARGAALRTGAAGWWGPRGAAACWGGNP